jgi:choline dehydrogenase-like flavoprotein
VPNLFVSDGSVMNTEAAANAALTVVAPGRPHRGAAESATVSSASDPGAGPTVLCLTEETVVLASSTIGCC